MIIQRLKNTSVSVPFAEVSRFAKEVGRKDLAALVRYLLQLEEAMHVHKCMCMDYHDSLCMHSGVDNSAMTCMCQQCTSLSCFSVGFLYLYLLCLIVLQLLDHEVHARQQVPLLIEMRKADLALDKAIESGDPQLGKLYARSISHVLAVRM